MVGQKGSITSTLNIRYAVANNILKLRSESLNNEVYSITLAREETENTWLNENFVRGVAYGQNSNANLYNTSFPLASTTKLKLNSFPIENFDKARYTILSNHNLNEKVLIKGRNAANGDNVINWLPYAINCEKNEETNLSRNVDPMNGLCVKCYLSDMFNNWLNTDWIEGDGGIDEISAITVENAEIKVKDIILANKVYNMLNRIAIADGTYQGWQQAVWGEEVGRYIESPVYIGGMSSEIVFDEVVSTAETQTETTNALGSLAGRGISKNQSGGTIKIRVEEPSIIMAVCSITPRIDYDACCKFYITEIDSIYDLHKPELDNIGFQNLPTRQMAGWDGYTSPARNYSAGKQPSWIQYQTAVNTVHGDFADDEKCGWMVFKRDYDYNPSAAEKRIIDLTTYIDPSKYNNPFAYKGIESQNYWVQLAFNVIARRKMSANQIPNL